MIVLSITEKGGAQRTESFDKNEINIGRLIGNDVVLPQGNISKHHARLLHRDGRFIVTDLKSTSGTYVNGRKIAQATLVTANDKIYIGDFVLRCQGMSEEMTVHAEHEEDEPVTAGPVEHAPGGPMQRPVPPDVFRDRAVVLAPSRIARVVVHARGALVTREVDLPADLAGGVVDVMIGGITTLAHGGSVRAALSGSSREVAQIETAIHHAAQRSEPGPTQSRVRDITERIARLEDEGVRLTRRRERVASIQLVPPIRTIDRRQVQRDGLDARITDAMRVAELISRTSAKIDEAIAAVRKELAEAVRELEAAQLEDAQASSVERMGDSHPTRAIIVRLSGTGAPGKLTITYAVPAARFWPTYTLRLADHGKRASWTFEAIVVQRSGEDWSGVPLSLSTGDLVFDARLPELTSLRIGRRTPPKRAAFRPPPEGIETMFSFYLEFAVTVRQHSAAGFRGAAAPRPQVDMDESMSRRRAMASFTTIGALGEEDDGDRATPPFQAMVPAAAPMGGMMRHAPPPAQAFGAPPPAMRARLAAPQQSMSRGGYGGAAETGSFEDSYEEPPEPDVVPSGAWDDYDSLALASAEDTSARGRLVAVTDLATLGSRNEAGVAIERMTVAGHVDPRESRGVFDHRYDADGPCDVPSDGRLHRVPLRTADCAARIHYTTVPMEAAEVYREAVLVNPFDGPLLAGPVDVYLDGTLLTTARMLHVDRGGELRVGMGVDDRFKVARNVRTSEESAGLIGGSLAVTHNVSIEVTASVRDRVSVTVLERVPITDEKAVKIELVGERPTGQAYDQSDRAAAMRGGRRFELALEPGKKGLIELAYRLVFSNKLDVVGGSRRG